MKHLLGLFLAAVATPALAQHDHQAVTQEAAGSSAEPQMDQKPVDLHAGHAMPPAPSEPTDPHAGHRAPAKDAQVEGHTWHEPGIPDPPVRGPSPAARGGPDHAADAVFGTSAMAVAREIVRKEHGDMRSGMILIDQLEAVISDGKDGYSWNAQGWYGGDINKLWVKSEGESRFGDNPEEAEIQALWSHALDPWWNLQTGVRQDFRLGFDRTYAVLGIQGLAPYWFEFDSAIFLSNKGDVTARVELEYDQRLTQRLILQPEIEFNFAAQDIPELGIGAGLSTAEFGLRLRYQFVPEFAPYVGVKYERAFGDTRDFRRGRDEKTGGLSFLIGIRSWF